jgi:phosphotransferase system HPr (HPr) family protein
MTGSATIKNERGIHARPSSEVAKEALKYKSKITITYNGKTANAKDVLQIIILELFRGTVIQLTTEGEDEKQAFDAIKALLEKEYKFD